METLHMHEVDYKPIIKHKDLLGFSVDLDITQIRVLDVLLANLYQLEEITYDEMTLDIEEYAKVADVPVWEAYQDIKNMIKLIFESVLVEEFLHGVTLRRVLSSMTYDDLTHTIKVKWFPDAVNLISGRMESGTFNRFDNRMCRTSSKVRYSFAELIQSLCYKKDFVLSLADIRDYLKLGNKYPEMREFKRNILAPTIKELLAYTGWIVEYSMLRSGRSIDRIYFKVKGKIVPKVYWFRRGDTRLRETLKNTKELRGELLEVTHALEDMDYERQS